MMRVSSNLYLPIFFAQIISLKVRVEDRLSTALALRSYGFISKNLSALFDSANKGAINGVKSPLDFTLISLCLSFTNIYLRATRFSARKPGFAEN